MRSLFSFGGIRLGAPAGGDVAVGGVHPDNGMWVGKISSETPSGTPSVTGTVTPRKRLPNLPIVPVATVGGHDTVFVLSEGCFLAARVGGFRCSGK